MVSSALSDLAEQQLQAHARAAPGRHAAGACLVLDALAGIGFAAGLAGAVAAVAAQRSVWGWLVLLVLAAALRGLLGRQAALAGQQAALAVKQGWRARLVRAALGGTAAAPHRETAGGEAGTARLASLAAEEIEALEAWVARFLPARRAAALAPLLVLAAVAIASPVTAAILAGTLLPFIVLMAFAGRASAAESHRQLAALARLSGLLADRVRALPVVLAMRAEERERTRLAAAAEEVALRTLRVLRLAFLSSAVLEFFAALCVALVAVYCGFGLLGLLPFPAPEHFALGPAFFVLALAPEFYLPMRRLAAAYHDRQAAQAAAERLLAFEGVNKTDTQALAPAPAAGFQGPPGLRFEGVSLSHGDTPAVLQDLGFDLPAGQMLALMGPSGSGKTTVLRALLGLAHRREGRILVDGLPLAAAGLPAACAVWIGQQPLIVPGTLRENLLLASPEASEHALAEAIEQAGLQPMLANRPLGLDTLLDERGGGLSGGERRRLALARALLKPGAWLWLLDEPTAHLDAEAETALIDTLARACAGRTALIATHSEQLAARAHQMLRLGGSA